MSLKEIEKLKEKLGKDPNLKLSVPLAEEYRKEGMLDEAIEILLKGIERQPTYMSARVLLGKIYSEKGMLHEARGEFEFVVRAVPDNLYASKKLAEIYRDTGELDLAIKSYRTVLKLNPMDDDSLASLRSLDAVARKDTARATEEEPAGRAVPKQEDVSPAPFPGEEAEAEETPAVGEESFAGMEMPDEGQLPEDEDFGAFKESLFGGGATEETEETLLEVVDAGEEEEKEEFAVSEDVLSADEEVSFGDVADILSEEVAPAGEVLPAEETAGSLEEPRGVELDVRDVPPDDLDSLVREADRFVSAGDFSAAMDMYRKAFIGHPEDKRIRQRMEELRSLLKLLGKDKEALIERLSTFLAAVRRRQDDFFGRP